MGPGLRADLVGREGNNTRPKAMKHIHNLHAPLTVGSLTYSEGIHDDVNKMVWGDQDFSTKTPCEETVEGLCAAVHLSRSHRHTFPS